MLSLLTFLLLPACPPSASSAHHPQATYASRLLQAKVDEIEIKIKCTNAAGELTSVRLVASSMGGKWLEVRGAVGQDSGGDG